MKGCAKARVAGIQRGVHPHIARRDIVQHDNVGSRFLIAGRCFAG